jgi:hypothetical protein
MNHHRISLANRASTSTSIAPSSPGTATGTEPDPAMAWLPDEGGQVHSWHSRRTSFRLSLAAIAVGGLMLIGSVVWMAVTQQGVRPVPGPLVADHNTHRVESVQSDMPAPYARFLLQARGAPLVTEVTTNLRCASARLVQGDQTSRWFGFSHPSEQFAGVQMLPFQPAYLDVRIDPASHSLAGDGPLIHNVLVKTQDGQVLNFEVTTGSE